MPKYQDYEVDYFEDSNGQGTIPSEVWDPEVSNWVIQPDPVSAPRILNITKQQTNGRDQNALKISISVMHKILKGRQRKIRTERFVKLLQEANRYKNYSTPVKFISLAHRANLITVLKEQFSQTAQKHIDKLFEDNTWTVERYNNTMICKMRVEKAINSKSFMDSLAYIWENNNHKNKYKSSEKEVRKFNNKIKKIKKAELIKKK